MIETLKRKIVLFTGWSPEKAHFFCSAIGLVFVATIASLVGLTIGYSALVGFITVAIVNCIVEVFDYRRKGFIEYGDIWFNFWGKVAGGTLFIILASLGKAIL